jgi:hypothetical protein
MVDGKPATQFVSTFGRLLESSYDGEGTTVGIHTGTDPD